MMKLALALLAAVTLQLATPAEILAEGEKSCAERGLDTCQAYWTMIANDRASTAKGYEDTAKKAQTDAGDCYKEWGLCLSIAYRANHACPDKAICDGHKNTAKQNLEWAKPYREQEKAAREKATTCTGCGAP